MTSDLMTRNGLTTEPKEPSMYAKLTEEFEETHFRDGGGGVQLAYITGEQCASRLNTVFGPLGWTFRVINHGHDPEADEYWVHGRLEVCDREGRVVSAREQFGSQKLKRSRTTSNPLDIGFDLKGAATDAMKKCASLFGVGLYLYEKEAKHAANAPAPIRGNAPMSQVQAVSGGGHQCEECGTDLTETRFKDGTVWSAEQLAGLGQRKHGKQLCMEHYRRANDAKRAQGEGVF